MNNAVVRLPEKRPNSDYDNMPEQTPEKRLKNVDSAMKLQSVGKEEGIRKEYQYCMVCLCNTDHSQFDCPFGQGMACSICWEPCEIKEHEDKLMLILKFCVRCGVTGKHWCKDCPSPIFDDDDDLFF